MIDVAVCDDVAVVGELLEEWTGKKPIKNILSSSRMVVAREGSELVGCAELIVIDDPFWNRRWGLVENVYVKKEHRGKGIGGRLMEAVENQARQTGCEFIKLTSRKEEGKALYRSLGYEEGSAFRRNLV